MHVFITLAVTKAAARMSRWLGRGGGHALPGLIAEKLDPNLAAKLVGQLPHGAILVTGTNGKTTTTKLIAAALEANGERVLTNSTGSNLKRGVVSALIGAADLKGNIDASIGLFEVDEASLRQVAPLIQPAHIVVLNLFRDQLDRYGELDTTAALIGQGIAATQAHVYINADDPLVASLAKYAASPVLVSYFGIEGLPSGSATAHQTATDSDRCPVCRERLHFSRVFYGHIGHYRCSLGHFTRPQPSVAVVNVEESGLNGSRFVVSIEGKRSDISFPLPGTYNLYNALAALSLANGLGLDQDKVASSLAVTQPAFGRVEKVIVEGRTLYLLLIKNPAGFTQVIETFLVSRPELQVMMAVNDLDADGRDVSWLWDVPLEALAVSAPKVFVSGIRGADMGVRLHYAGIEAELVQGFDECLDAIIKATPDGGDAYILPTYTAMLDIRKRLSKRARMQEVWK
jgi:lipid II isoglutaminyl synthase (glutamine-hydrolysing)